MTLATQTIQNLYLPDGVQTVFPFGFKCMAQTNLGVYTIDKTSGARTRLSLGTHYNVTGVGVETGGSVVLVTPPPSTVFLFVISDTPLVQEQAYVEGDNFPAKSHERALDTLVRMMQERKGDIARCLSVPPEDNITLILPNAQARANAFLYFDELGQIAIGDPESIAARSETAADEAEAAQAAAEAAQGLAETAQAAAEAAESACAGYEAAVEAEGTTQVGRVIAQGDIEVANCEAQVTLASNAATLASEWAQNPEDDPVEPGEYSAYHWSKKAESAAQGGSFKVSADDTTPGYLETKVVASTGIVLATQNGGANETRSIAADVGTTAGKLVQLDEDGRLPALDARNLTNVSAGDQTVRDNAAMTALLAQLSAGRASGPVPGGGLFTFQADELISQVAATYSAAGDYYTNAGTPTQVAQGTGVAIGTMTGGGGLAAAFNGNTNQGNTQGAYVVAALGYVGKDWGSGVTKRVQGFRCFASNNYGYAYPLTNTTATISLLGSNTNDPATATVLGSTTVANTSSGIAEYTDASITAAYRYHWLRVTAGAATQISCPEVQFFEAGAATNMSVSSPGITLGSAPNKATLYLLHEAIDATVLNTDVQVAVWRSGWVIATDLTTLCQFDASYKLLRATVELNEGTGTVLNWRVQTFNNKAQRVRAALLWAE